ncbi:hypothetical protein B0H13DRAFT_1886754 [Mycena leptocephala]|nr:hypothetical protein B0H13DRAFT_1886754 [Mycena leptocephala]
MVQCWCEPELVLCGDLNFSAPNRDELVTSPAVLLHIDRMRDDGFGFRDADKFELTGRRGAEGPSRGWGILVDAHLAALDKRSARPEASEEWRGFRGWVQCRYVCGTPSALGRGLGLRLAGVRSRSLGLVAETLMDAEEPVKEKSRSGQPPMRTTWKNVHRKEYSWQYETCNDCAMNQNCQQAQSNDERKEQKPHLLETTRTRQKGRSCRRAEFGAGRQNNGSVVGDTESKGAVGSSEYWCRSKGLVGGRKVGLRWKGFTGDVLALEHSCHWPRRSWWFGIKREVFGNVGKATSGPFHPSTQSNFRLAQKSQKNLWGSSQIHSEGKE